MDAVYNLYIFLRNRTDGGSAIPLTEILAGIEIEEIPEQEVDKYIKHIVYMDNVYLEWAEQQRDQAANK